MWKQFLNRLPRKSSKSDSPLDPNPTDPGPGLGPGPGPGPNASIKRAPPVVPSSPAAEPFLSFNDVAGIDKPGLFVSKLGLCCVLYDFSDPNKSSAEKDLKRQTLIELAAFLPTWAHRFTEPMIAASCRMFAVNLFRVFPPNYRSGSAGGEADEDEPVFDPAWTHLQFVYDLLLKFVASSSLDPKLGRSYVDQHFIGRLLELFDSEDPRERDCLKTVLHRIYGKFMAHRAFIRKAVSNIFYRFVFETEKHSGIAELLEIFGSVISGFALPLKEEHKLFLCRALIPLHKPKTVGAYMQQLTYCVIQFIEKEPKLASIVIMGLLKYWPVTNSQKEVMFLGELEELLESTNMAEFQKCMVPLFRRIGCSLNSSHFQVAERALFLWHNDHLINLIAQNRQVILPLVIPALERNTRHHWNKAVLNVTLNVRKMFSDMDEELFISCQDKFEREEEARLAVEEKRKMIWERLEIAATASAFEPVTGSTILVSPAVVPPIAAATPA